METKSNSNHGEPNWEKIIEKSQNISFKGKLFGREVEITNKQIRIFAVAFALLCSFLLVRNVVRVFTYEAPPLPEYKAKYIDENVLMQDSSLMNLDKLDHQYTDEEKRKIKNLKAAAYDSLIENGLLSPETSKKIEEKYPDSLCGC